MNILVFSQMYPCLRHPTSAVFFANLMKELAPMVDELIVVTPRPYIPHFIVKKYPQFQKWFLDPMHSSENNIEIIRPYFLCLRGEAYEGINGILMQYSLHNKLQNIVRENKIDLILGYNMIPDGIAAVRFANKMNLPVGFWVIGTDVNKMAGKSRINAWLSKECINNSNIIITESMDLENKVKKSVNNAQKIKTFYKGIDLTDFVAPYSKSRLMKEMGMEESRHYILFVGRVIREKGIFELSQSFNDIARKFPDYDMIILGEATEADDVKKCFKSEEIMKRIHFKGIVSYNEVARYMKISDLLVFPSWAEGLPNVVIEAMAAGLPVVATNIGGIPEILKNGITGLSVPARDTSKLTDAVLTMIEDDELRQKCINNARDLVMNKFDVKNNTTQLYELLQEVVKNYAEAHQM